MFSVVPLVKSLKKNQKYNNPKVSKIFPNTNIIQLNLATGRLLNLSRCADSSINPPLPQDETLFLSFNRVSQLNGEQSKAISAKLFDGIFFLSRDSKNSYIGHSI